MNSQAGRAWLAARQRVPSWLPQEREASGLLPNFANSPLDTAAFRSDKCERKQPTISAMAVARKGGRCVEHKCLLYKRSPRGYGLRPAKVLRIIIGSAKMAAMRLTLIMLTLVLTMANALAMAQAGAYMVGSAHHDTEIEHGFSGEQSHHHDVLLTHHGCHTHAHVFILPQSCPNVVPTKETAWTRLGAPSPRLIGYAPPVPPPKA
jgi:hypothetical protein